MTIKIHSQSGLDKTLSALATTVFIGRSCERHISDGELRRSARNSCFNRAVKITETAEDAQALFDQVIAWAEEFTKDLIA